MEHFGPVDLVIFYLIEVGVVSPEGEVDDHEGRLDGVPVIRVIDREETVIDDAYDDHRHEEVEHERHHLRDDFTRDSDVDPHGLEHLHLVHHSDVHAQDDRQACPLQLSVILHDVIGPVNLCFDFFVGLQHDQVSNDDDDVQND